MPLIKNMIYSVLFFLTLVSFSQCSSVQNMQTKPPVYFGEVYCQSWVAGTREGGAGVNLFIPIKKINETLLDSVYFRGKVVKLKLSLDSLTYVGRFKRRTKQYDIIMSNEEGAEYGNKVPEIPKKMPFELEANECVISYLKKGKTKYYKISGIMTKSDKVFKGMPKPVPQ